MRLLVVESEQDPASVNIAERLRALRDWRSTKTSVLGHPVEAFASGDVGLVRVPFAHLHSEVLEGGLKERGLQPEALVFLSKHKAASGQRALTVHPVGNYNEALYGGLPGRLGPCLPALQTELLRALAQEVKAENYPAQVTFEVTHHGPLLPTPSCFLELGSGPEHWGDAVGAEVVARALLKVASRPLPAYPTAVGLGGGHYAPRFTEAALAQRVHFGHMIPNHAAEAVEDAAAMARQALDSSRGAQGIYLHRKSLPKDVLARWKAALQEAGIPMLDSSTWMPLEATP